MPIKSMDLPKCIMDAPVIRAKRSGTQLLLSLFFSPGFLRYQRQKSSFNPLPDNKILDWSELKQSADDNFEFDVNSRKFSKLVENTVGKGKIAHYEQLLFFPQCF